MIATQAGAATMQACARVRGDEEYFIMMFKLLSSMAKYDGSSGCPSAPPTMLAGCCTGDCHGRCPSLSCTR
eukprot:176109-Rhodomonas_salina.1